MILTFIKKYKIQIKKAMFILLVVAGTYMVASNNYRFYSTPIGSVIEEQSEFIKTVKGMNGEEENYYSQKLTLKVRNTSLIGREVEITNEYALSQINSTKYETGDDLFLNVNEEGGGDLAVSISNVKRDKYTILMVTVFVVIMIMVAGKRGILTITTLIINILIFALMVYAYVKDWDFENMLFLLAVVFATLTLLILGGIRKKSVGSIISTIVTIWVIMIIYHVVYSVSTELPYEMMNYISGPDYLEVIFRAGIILGCLGAIMDIAITINSSVHELVETIPSITTKELYRSVKEIGYDIMGTMINVLFFTFVSGCIPMILLKIVNGYSLINIIHYSIVFDTIRFLMGAIGIVLAIPLSSFVAILFVRNRLVKKNAI